MVVGITGGIATGKSTVTCMLRDRGAITFSADEAARAVLTGNTILEIRSAFGENVVLSTGDLDRDSLARLVFGNQEAREILNRIMHPRIRRLLSDQIRSAQDDFPPPKVIAVEIPLLYEGNMQSWFERIVVVAASVNVQAMRLKVRNRLNYRQAQARIASQKPLDEKAADATYVVFNNGNVSELTPQVDVIWGNLIAGPAFN